MPPEDVNAGSSPHTRGAPTFTAQVGVDLRIIPAYAGSTPTSLSLALTPPDHPRIRGEHPARIDPARRPVGSSPHTRGARRRGAAPCGRRRIIPAYAGSTSRGCSSRRLSGDHPRIRGEHTLVVSRVHLMPGSSPHTRGAHARGIQGPFDSRIIPAYAGSTDQVALTVVVAGDHPRIRGEHAAAALGPLGGVGSSPHTRGARPAGRGRR